ncbi:hypothetical protein F2Q69_00035028 [Brassica cretica]|uniref:Uncharacterized protein n=1 Tax=Brassica cretica TaxID=69181 RepID=A0A8S9SJD9_BRACR|nr:hypothetical protein F2Q69_00035028 [Brassica cretica]
MVVVRWTKRTVVLSGLPQHHLSLRSERRSSTETLSTTLRNPKEQDDRSEKWRQRTLRHSEGVSQKQI